MTCLVLLDEYHIHAILKKAGLLVFNPPDADFKTKIQECNQYIREEIEEWESKTGKNTKQ